MKKIDIYTRPGCAYCVSAKRLLTAQGLEFIEHDVAAKPEAFKALRRRSPQRTFPQIFIDDCLLGGFDDLLQLKQSQGLMN